MQDRQAIKVLLVDNRAMFSSGLSALLQSYPDFSVVGLAGDVEEAFMLCERNEPDVVALEIDLRGRINGIEAIRMLRDQYSGVRVLVLTNVVERDMIHRALQEGATSYLLKSASAEELVQAIRAAHHSVPVLSPEVTRVLMDEVIFKMQVDHGLSAREHEVLELVSQGMNNRQIAQALNVSLSTVQFHVSNILAKLEVHNRIEAATFAIRHQLVGERAGFRAGNHL